MGALTVLLVHLNQLPLLLLVHLYNHGCYTRLNIFHQRAVLCLDRFKLLQFFGHNRLVAHIGIRVCYPILCRCLLVVQAVREDVVEYSSVVFLTSSLCELLGAISLL